VTTPGPRQRREVLADLIGLRSSLDTAIAAVRELPWDSDVELVQLARTNVEDLLHRYLRGELSAADLEAWANAVESREDIGLEHGHEELLGAFLFETANPLLAEPISHSYARRWLKQIGSGW